MSVQVATEVYSENKKVDSGRQHQYEMEKVVEGLFGECTVEFTGDIVRNVSDMVATYQRHKQAAKSSNPLVQLVIIWWMKCSETRH